MKTILGGLLLLVSTASFACPNLEGTYNCTVNGTDYATRVIQENRGGAMYYEITSDIETQGVTADGTWRSYPASGNLRNTQIRGICEGNTLVLGVKGDVFFQGRNVGSTNTVTRISKAGTAIRNNVVVDFNGRTMSTINRDCPSL